MADSDVPARPDPVVASRGDALTRYLVEALERRYGSAVTVDPELTRAQRYLVAGLTFRLRRKAWIERFYKSTEAIRIRTRNGLRAVRSLPRRPRAVLQVHALFSLPGVPSALYIDCTHAQSAEFWPPWNPLRGSALDAYLALEQKAYDNARHLFTFSRATRDSLITRYHQDPDKVTVVGLGVNFSSLPEARAEDAPARDPDRPIILFVGHDFDRKGGPLLLEAFRRVRESVPGARLVLAGEDPGIDPQDGVEVLGRIEDRAEIAALYRDATVFAMPTHFDAGPLVALEAMAYGLPVVLTRQMGAADMVEDGETGRLVPVGDVDALVWALIEIVTDPDLARSWGSAARRDVEARFSWDAVVERMAPVLDRMIDTPDP